MTFDVGGRAKPIEGSNVDTTSSGRLILSALEVCLIHDRPIGNIDKKNFLWNECKGFTQSGTVLGDPLGVPQNTVEIK